MIEIATKEDLRHLQKQLNAIYRHLKVYPLYHPKTDEMGVILVSEDRPNLFQREQHEIEDKFHES